MKPKILFFLSLLVFPSCLLVGSPNDFPKPLFQSVDEQDSTDKIQNKNDTLKARDNFQRRIPSETASSVQLSTADFHQGALLSPLEMIKGKIPGMRISRRDGSPGSYSRLSFRGDATLDGESQPLYVIDGIPYDSKRHSFGNNPLIFVEPQDIDNIIVHKDAASMATYGSRSAEGVIVINTKKASKDQPLHIRYNGELSMSSNPKRVPVLDAREFRSLVQDRYADNEYALNELGNEKTNWQDVIFRNSFNHNHHLAFSGSLPEISIPFRASVGYNNEEGIMKTSSFKRTSGSLKINPSFFDDFLKMHFNIRAINLDNRMAREEAFRNAIMFNPTHPVYDEGNDFGGYFTNRNDSVSVNTAPKNPLALLEQTNNTLDGHQIFSKFGFDYRFHFLPGLRIKVNYGLNDSEYTNMTDVASNAAWRNDSYSSQGGYYEEATTTNTDEVLSSKLSFDETFEKINSELSLNMGYLHQKLTSDYEMTLDRNTEDDYMNDEINTTEEYITAEIFGGLNFNFDERYFLNLSFNRSKRSIFSEGNKAENFPAAAVAWQLNNESFMKKLDFLNDLKLRLSYGKSSRFDMEKDFYADVSRDPGLKMPVTTTLNGGLNFSIVDNRIHGSVDWYQRETKDMILLHPVVDGTSFSYIWKNNGELENTGWEFSVSTIPVNKEKIRWKAGINFAANNNTLVKLFSGENGNTRVLQTGDIYGDSYTAMMNAPNHSRNSFYLFEQSYDSEGSPLEGVYKDKNNDGVIDSEDRRFHKNPEPDVTMGFFSDIKYKNFVFSFSGRVWTGNYVYNNVSSYHSTYENLYGGKGFLQNISTEYNHFEQSRLLSDHYAENASFLKIDHLTFRYLLPEMIDNTLNMGVYISIQNALTLTNYKGLDPEIPSGIDYLRYPVPRVFRLGVTADFL